MKEFETQVGQFVESGACQAEVSGRPVLVYGAIPGEVVRARVIGKKKGVRIAVVVEVLEASPDRMTPQEEHFVSCSPWQILTATREAQEKQLRLALLAQDAGIAVPVQFQQTDLLYGYRTKVEYSFADRDGPLSLAFHERGGSLHRLRLPDGCALCSSVMNTLALRVGDLLRQEGITATQLKTLVVRESKSTGKHLVLLYVKDPEFPATLVLDRLIALALPSVVGIQVFFSDKRSPASVPTATLGGWGTPSLTDRVGQQEIAYSWDAFFQNNIPMFEQVLMAMKQAIPTGTPKLVELYSGAGTIGLALAAQAGAVVGVEIIESAAQNANENAMRNSVPNYRAIAVSAQAMDETLLEGVGVVVLDPPRSGLHPRVIEMIQAALPETVLYLACDPKTQMRDVAILRSQYAVESVTGYDFYPRTPHMESLVVLRRR